MIAKLETIKEKLKQAIYQSLDREQRLMIVMTYVDDMTFPEIAQVLDVTADYVENRISHAMRQLKADIEND